MFSKLRLFVLASVLAIGLGGPVTPNLTVREARASIPAGFTQGNAAPGNQMLNLRLALTSSNMTGLESVLYAVSTPDSAQYGQYLSKEEVEEYVKPTSETVTKVNDFLSQNGITAKSVSPAGDWLSFSVPVSKANELFGADFTEFTHQQTGQQIVRTLSYSIPSDLSGHIDLVHPTTAFVVPNARIPITSKPIPAQKRAASAPASCDSIVTPACLQDLYGIPTTMSTQQSQNGIGIAGYVGQYASDTDLTRFLTNLRPDLPASTNFTVLTVDDGTYSQNASSAGTEASLDVQYSVGLASGVPVTFYSVGADTSDDLDGFLDLANFILAQDQLPTVFSTSYGFNEDTIWSALADNLCNAYMQLGARGVSVLYASGDGGVSGSQDETCTWFVPTFPSVCPFVTSVGSTSGISETAAPFSSGGFSNIFDTPSFQTDAVNAYIASLGSSYYGDYDVAGRAYPDIAAQGMSFEIMVDGIAEAVSGTSASSPVFASVIALLNDQLLAAGKPTLGYLNPFLYSAKGQAALNDITTGSNPGCDTNGFNATAGWDPVTGLGTPDFAKLLTAVGL